MQLFGVYSDLALFSNFTYFLDNPTQGDQFSQTRPPRHRRRERDAHAAGRRASVRAYGDGRFADAGRLIDGVGLFHTEDRVRYATVRQDDVRETGIGRVRRGGVAMEPEFRTMFGVRGDAYTFDVTSEQRRELGAPHGGDREPEGVDRRSRRQRRPSST